MGSISDSSTSTAINPMMERYVDDTGRRLLDALFEMGAPEGGERGFRPRKFSLRSLELLPKAAGYPIQWKQKDVLVARERRRLLWVELPLQTPDKNSANRCTNPDPVALEQAWKQNAAHRRHGELHIRS